MAKIAINVGSSANDGTGDQLRTAFISTNSNFDEVYAGTATVAQSLTPATIKGVSGDTAGQIAYDGVYVYVCYMTWTDGAADIWHRITGAWV